MKVSTDITVPNAGTPHNNQTFYYASHNLKVFSKQLFVMLYAQYSYDIIMV